jgi:HAE1 family hydrophobic/amphiphilic exporter-1
MQLAREMPALVDVRSTYVAGKPGLTFTPDREQMNNYGATTGQVAQTLRTAFEGDVPTRYREIDEEYDIRVQLGEDERTEANDFTDIFLRLGPNTCR